MCVRDISFEMSYPRNWSKASNTVTILIVVICLDKILAQDEEILRYGLHPNGYVLPYEHAQMCSLSLAEYFLTTNL